ncbi:MAG: HlyD family efflux transporter periplasmic adaptor subunit [Gammaproteobacteria bacterium]|uniref:efflux RND transporter periplasmic adaptor subunit n=1 Tax=Halomonas sp. EF61 TaxID=2950869 RepID=UPI0032DF161F|nr:HlyD family efflux transporter periplasmic adaptor subunit [Gammaproteobacteria bacterium]
MTVAPSRGPAAPEVARIGGSLSAAGDARQDAAGVGAQAGAMRLLRIEGELRECGSLDQLWCHLANEGHGLLDADQSLVLSRCATRRWRVQAVGGVSRPARDSALVRDYERLVRRLGAASESEPRCLDILAEQGRDGASPMMGHGLWVPLTQGRRCVGAGWLLVRRSPWEEAHLTLARRLADAYGHGVCALLGSRRSLHAWRRRGPWLAAVVGVGLVAALALVRVPLSVLAPAEVVPEAPFVVAAPLAGVVEKILVTPGARVSRGDPLVQLVDLGLRNDFEVAERKVQVARSRALRLQQAAISRAEAKRELATAQSELRLAEAERDYARQRLGEAVIRAERPGVALYSDPQDWVGRPVKVGEALMQVADATSIAFRLEVAAPDAVNLVAGAKVSVFLDAAPLDPLDASLERASYKAEPDASGVARFEVLAKPQTREGWVPRMGLRGTARIQGTPVTLFYYLFRRPLVAVRQLTGM